MSTGRAEFVAAPTLSHESRAAAAGDLFSQIGFALADAGSNIEVMASRATRLLSSDGAFEPDEGLFIGASKIDAAERIDGWLDVRKGHPVPDLVVEIDRSTDSSGKLAPYFRMGVRGSLDVEPAQRNGDLDRDAWRPGWVSTSHRQRGPARRDAIGTRTRARCPLQSGPPVPPAAARERGRVEYTRARYRRRAGRGTRNLTTIGGPR